MIRGRAMAIPAFLVALIAGCAEFDYGAASGPRAGRPSSAPTVYEVRRGDTLYSIAFRHGLDFREVARWNGIGSPYMIRTGQELRLRRPPSAPERRAVAEGPPAAEPQAPSPPVAERSPQGAGTTSPDWRWPVRGEVVKAYNPNGPGKRGISIGGERGDPVRAAARGRVVYSGDGLRGYGNLVIIKHNTQYLTAYGYNSELLVSEGDSVASGQVIARLGEAPGGGAALHFEMRREGQAIDPTASLPDS